MERTALEFVAGGSGRHDIYLAPHSDDICFSLGHFARSRGAGTLLTVFPVSGYRAGSRQFVAEEVRSVTRMRMAEDAAFAQACGLAPRWLNFPDAFVRRQPPFDAAPAAMIGRDISHGVLRALLGPTIGRVARHRPWLFCPAGIGGHVDHMALTTLVIGRLDALRPYYRIAFYEDLHYASKLERRREGLKILRELVGGLALERRVVLLGDPPAQSSKMHLVRLYPSQLTPALSSLAAYVPAAEDVGEPHEAVWVFQDDEHQRPG